MPEKQKCKYVFVVVVYKNSSDLHDFIHSVERTVTDFTIVIVNSFYDIKTEEHILNISKKYCCHFISVDNKGYGFGNNRGVEYALQNINFEYLIISNPDIIIKKFDDKLIDHHRMGLIGPMIKTLSNKSQNPYWAIRNSLVEGFIYKGYKYNLKLLLYLSFAVNKTIREIFLLISRISTKRYINVFALHGSFVIFPKSVIDKIGLPYDEEMFLFAEEAHLAHLLRRIKMKSFLTKDIFIVHKEDGSIAHANLDIRKHLKDSVLTYYEKLNQNGEVY